MLHILILWSWENGSTTSHIIQNRWSHKGLKTLLNRSLWCLLRSNPQDSNGILPCLNMHQNQGLQQVWFRSSRSPSLGYTASLRLLWATWATPNKQSHKAMHTETVNLLWRKLRGKKYNCYKIKSIRLKF